MFKSIFSVAITVAATAILVFALNGNNFFGVAKMLFTSNVPNAPKDEGQYVKRRDLPPSKQQIPNTDALFIPEISLESSGKNTDEYNAPNSALLYQTSSIDKELSASVARTDELLQDALAHPAYDEYEALVKIVQDYKDYEATNVFAAVKTAEGQGEDSADKKTANVAGDSINESAYVLNMIDRHIFVWASFYYYVHNNAQMPIRGVLSALREQHKELARQVARQDPLCAGKISTEYIKLLVDDIAKSGRRNNSDFIRFSYADYANYRAFFDEQWAAYPEFHAAFAQEGITLFDSLYTMHKDVPPEQNAEVRAMLQAMREELVSLHQKAILETAQKDRTRARLLAEDITKLLSEQLELRREQHLEVLDFIRLDRESYTRFIEKNLRLN